MGKVAQLAVEGILTNIPLHRELMLDANFEEGGTSIHYLEHKLEEQASNSTAVPSGFLSLAGHLSVKKTAIPKLKGTAMMSAMKAVTTVPKIAINPPNSPLIMSHSTV